MTDTTPKSAPPSVPDGMEASATVSTLSAPPFPPITLTEEDWLDFFDEVDASDAEKLELINVLWTMMRTWVDVSWTCRFAQETSGQRPVLAGAFHQVVLDLDAEKEAL